MSRSHISPSLALLLNSVQADLGFTVGDDELFAMIIRGLPGSGKTTMARRLLGLSDDPKSAVDVETFQRQHNLVCADDYFMRDGVYRFDPSKIGEAHNHCVREWTGLVTFRSPHSHEAPIIVHNTACSAIEVAPYWAVASAYKRKVLIVTLEQKVELCMSRQTHDVSPKTMGEMLNELVHAQLPPWWTNYVVKPDLAGAILDATPETVAASR